MAGLGGVQSLQRWMWKLRLGVEQDLALEPISKGAPGQSLLNECRNSAMTTTRPIKVESRHCDSHQSPPYRRNALQDRCGHSLSPSSCPETQAGHRGHAVCCPTPHPSRGRGKIVETAGGVGGGGKTGSSGWSPGCVGAETSTRAETV